MAYDNTRIFWFSGIFFVLARQRLLHVFKWKQSFHPCLMESTDLVHNYSATREGVCQPRRFTHLACDARVFLHLTRRELLSFC